MRSTFLALAVRRPLTSARAAAPLPPPAKAEDVSSIDNIMKAVYDVTSGPPARSATGPMRSLFIGARLIPTARAGRRAAPGCGPWGISNAGPRLEESGFFERELGRVEERYGNIVHLMSAYDSKRKADDAQPFARGVNSFQLFNDGSRWWVVTIFWQGESPDTPIPAKFINK
jgi:hypothetical protein